MKRSLFLFAGVPLLCLAACSPSGRQADGGDASAGPRTDAEERAKRFILDTESDPKSVEFSRFGPNDEKGEIQDWSTKSGGKIVRVRYRAKNLRGALELKDVLVFEAPDGQCVTAENQRGNDWLEFSRKHEKQAGDQKPRFDAPLHP